MGLGQARSRGLCGPGRRVSWARTRLGLLGEGGPALPAPVLAPTQEERTCIGGFFMLRRFRVLTVDCVPDRKQEQEQEQEVSPARARPPLPLRFTRLRSLRRRLVTACATDFGAWGLSVLTWKMGPIKLFSTQTVGRGEAVCEEGIDLDDC